MNFVPDIITARPAAAARRTQPARARRWLPAVAAALALAGALPTARALTFNINYTGTTAQQQAAFQVAANYWSSLITTNVTVNFDVSFANLGSNVLGQASTSITTASYTAVRSALQATATSVIDLSSTANLQSGAALSFLSTDLNGATRTNNDTSGTYSVDNTRLGMSTANAKALGLLGATLTADATLEFSNQFSFRYDRSVAFAGSQTDFITVAEHEIGHALGFLSGVDDVDYCMVDGATPACNADNRYLETQATYGVLDLFRYSAANVLDLRVGGNPYLSIDGGATSVAPFSTGEIHGNTWQASHFGTADVTLMRPFVGTGEAYDAMGEDLTAFDVIGWTLASAVPEPGTWGLMALGLLGLGGVRLRARRRIG